MRTRCLAQLVSTRVALTGLGVGDVEARPTKQASVNGLRAKAEPCMGGLVCRSPMKTLFGLAVPASEGVPGRHRSVKLNKNTDHLLLRGCGPCYNEQREVDKGTAGKMAV